MNLISDTTAKYQLAELAEQNGWTITESSGWGISTTYTRDGDTIQVDYDRAGRVRTCHADIAGERHHPTAGRRQWVADQLATERRPQAPEVIRVSMTRWAYGLRSLDHLLVGRVSTVHRGDPRRMALSPLDAIPAPRATTDRCACGATLSGIGSEDEPIRQHLVAVLGHVVEFVRIGPDTLPEDPTCDAVTVGCVCGWQAEFLPDMVTARALHDVHAAHPDVLVPGVVVAF